MGRIHACECAMMILELDLYVLMQLGNVGAVSESVLSKVSDNMDKVGTC